MRIAEIDDNVLGMYVDGELSDTSREVVLAAMEEDSGIREGIYELRRAKELVQLGFGEATAPIASVNTSSTQVGVEVLPNWSKYFPKFSLSIAASFFAASLLVLSFCAGNGHFGNLGGLVTIAESQQNIVPMSQDKVLLHISESDPKEFMAVLTYARKFLDKHRESDTQLSVVAHAGGLDMLREGVSPVRDEVLAMMQEYQNIHFIACANSILALRKKGIEPVIFNNIDTSKPAMEQIIKHVRDGWSYIRVKSVAGATAI